MQTGLFCLCTLHINLCSLLRTAFIVIVLHFGSNVGDMGTMRWEQHCGKRSKALHAHHD